LLNGIRIEINGITMPGVLVRRYEIVNFDTEIFDGGAPYG
jgi:hypothetical protein